MNKRKFIQRLIVSPFILGILICSYTFGCIKHFGMYLKYGGEWITYTKGDPKRMEDIYKQLKEQHENNSITN